MLIARQEELEFMDKLAVLNVVPVEQCLSETSVKPIGTKWIDINEGDGDRLEISGTRTEGSSSEDGHLAWRRLQCNTVGSRAIVEERPELSPAGVHEHEFV